MKKKPSITKADRDADREMRQNDMAAERRARYEADQRHRREQAEISVAAVKEMLGYAERSTATKGGTMKSPFVQGAVLREDNLRKEYLEKRKALKKRK